MRGTEAGIGGIKQAILNLKCWKSSYTLQKQRNTPRQSQSNETSRKGGEGVEQIKKLELGGRTEVAPVKSMRSSREQAWHVYLCP
jgi:hypothetical protein